MARAGTIAITIVGDADKFKRELNDVDGRMGKLGGGLKSFGKTAAAGFAVGGAAAVAFGVAAVKAFSEAQQIAAQTEAVIKSTGGAANVTAKDVDTLAGSLSMLSGVDDEVIASGQNVLLTFTKVHNETGKGNDIFDQATKSALDLSVALGTDLQSANIMVGKALNDPVKGMAAMSRAGIQFTQAQKDQVKALIASGDTLGAQKIILAELQTQFGGSAEAAGDTFAGSLNKLRVITGNLMEDVGARLVPVLTTLAEWAADHIPAALAAAGAAFERIKKFIAPVIELVQGVIDRFRSGQVSIGESTEGIRGILEQLKSVFSSAFGAISAVVSAAVDFLRGVWRVFGDDLTSFARESWAAITEVIRGALNAIIGIWDLVEAIFTGKWGDAWNAVKAIVDGIWDAIFGLVRNAITNVIPTIISGAGQALASAFRTAFDGLKSAFSGVLNWAIDKWNDFKIPAVEVLGVQVTPEINFPDLPRFHEGGIVPGRPGQDVLAMLRAGERVTPAGAASSITINAMTNASAADIASELAWTMRTAGV